MNEINLLKPSTNLGPRWLSSCPACIVPGSPKVNTQKHTGTHNPRSSILAKDHERTHEEGEPPRKQGSKGKREKSRFAGNKPLGTSHSNGPRWQYVECVLLLNAKSLRYVFGVFGKEGPNVGEQKHAIQWQRF